MNDPSVLEVQGIGCHLEITFKDQHNNFCGASIGQCWLPDNVTGGGGLDIRNFDMQNKGGGYDYV